MANLKWIYFVALFEHLLSFIASQGGGSFIYPNSDEDTANLMRNYQTNWQVARPSGSVITSYSSGPIKTSYSSGPIKTSFSSLSRMDTDDDPAVMRYSPYNAGGSAAQANAGSMSYMQPGYYAGPGPSGSSSGSFASASSSSFSMSGAQCLSEPKPVANGRMRCSSGTCEVKCLPDYRFPTGHDTLYLGCSNGRWLVKNMELNDVPPCEPICLPRCLNNGICIAPGQCKCPQNFMGPTCQMEKKLCLASPPLPANAKRSCTQSLCTFSCMKGHKFPDGTLSMNLQCLNGEWKPERQDLKLIPDCLPICEPPCLNGGNCVGYNTCQCTKDFRGAKCQWGTDRCATTKMKFNGGFSCSGTADSLVCKLSCPKGINFEYEPAEAYACSYEMGEFLPKNVPRCVYAAGMQIIQSQPTSQYSQTNGTLYRTGGQRKVIEVEEEEDDDDEEIEETETIIKKTIVTKKKKKGKKTYLVDEDEEFFEAPGVYSLYMIQQDLEVTYRTPKPSVCMTWIGNKIKTFDGVTYSHELICSHVMVQDYVDGTFNVILRACPTDSVNPCPHALEIFMQNEQFTFENVGGQLKMFTTKKEFPIPVQMTGLKVTRSGTDVRIVLEQIPITITWDSKKFVQIEATESVWNRTAGLCGTMDGIMSNDFMSKDGSKHKMASTFVDSWRAPNVDRSREKCIPRSQPITSIKCETSVDEKANIVCTDLLKNPKMKNCLKMFDEDILMKNCISDYCSCKNTYERTECTCDGVSALAEDCRFRGVMLDDGWRDWQICPLNCTNGRVYKSCGPLNEPSCGSAIESDSFNCREGCFCPEGTMLNDGICVKAENCPCRLKGRVFPPKSIIKKDCNTCECQGGNWKCTSITCGSRCAAIGDPHYSTFDGKRYDFMGKCSYYLMQTREMSVEAENVACSGAISENMNFLPSFTTEMPSCTKSLTIKFNDDAGQLRVIKLKQGGFVLLDGFEVPKLPRELSNGAVKIRQASSSFVIVDFQDGVTIWWDGVTRAYIDAPASYRGMTQGLCGTFNSNMQDDFLTPEGDIETTVHQFANKWQTKDSCDFLTDKIVPHPCQMNVEQKAKAERICAKLRDKVFEDCHLFVDPEEFYEDCMYDVCACKGDISQCFCPIFAAYAAECSRQGTILEWRYKVSECAINCPNGQVFQQCGEACTRTCSDLQSETPCKLLCVEGCRCPEGQVLDENNECVTVAMCKCAYKNMEFKPGYKEVRPGRRFLELCSCFGGQWRCIEAVGDDAVKYPAASDMSKKCSVARNEVFTTCESAEPLTCKNMHINVSTTTALCRPGCVCKDGYVLDTISKQCVLPEKCSCHHGGKSYSDGEQMREDCNTCSCKGGRWDCTTKACASTCSAWGDSHFTTFDGREFDFQGVCSYVLAKGKLTDGDGFSVTIQNVLCGSNGVTCSKSLEINLVGNEPESIALSSDLPVPGIRSKPNAKPLKKMFTFRSGMFIVVELPHIGVSLKWDRGTRVYLKLESRWKGRVQGLCGNYNYDALDDFMNPSLGVESNPIIFGHSWKLEDSCAVPTEQVDSCALNPQRKIWAQRKCGLLKSSEFAKCHSEVSVDSFYKRCIFDTCSCDQGGDCECLCTALSAYAFACSTRGIFIRWRTPDLCPMQCDPTCSNYYPCIPSCPPDTCDNLMHPLRNQRLCKDDVCVEGCKIKECPDGTVYNNGSYIDCVPKSTCKPICLVENGVTYYEGDIMISDACHSCTCTRGSKVCSGKPCITDEPDAREADLGCITGWSEWINQDVLDQSSSQGVKTSKSNYFKEDDVEPLPNNLQMKNLRGSGKAICSSEYFAAVECRSVVDHSSPKKTGQNVECSLERGFLCKGQCFDYEMRVYCECGDATTLRPSTYQPIIIAPSTIPALSPIKEPSYIKVCDPNIPNNEHPFSCNKFLQCVMSANGSYVYAEKTCGNDMMYNPKNGGYCDWPASVKAVKPKCALTPVEPEKERSRKICPPGYVWSECAMPCNRACNYYKQQLQMAGNCSTASSDCIAGCLPVDAELNCDYPRIWRDYKTCVDLQTCTCMGPSNEILRPGQVIYVSDCKTCQCLNNEYICANVPCRRMSTPPQPIILSSTLKPIDRPPVVISENIEYPYYITTCDPSVPHIEHPKSCYKFLHCVQKADGNFAYAVKTCFPDMMYNPKTMTCDWPAAVKAMKPKCGYDAGEIEIWETEEIIMKLKRTTRFPSTTQRVPAVKVVDIPYYIQICDPSVVLTEHPESCFKYLQCQQMPNGTYIYVEKVCGTGLMFNPNAMVCDWPAAVKTMKPICGVTPGTVEIFTTLRPIISELPVKIVATPAPTIKTTFSYMRTPPPSVVISGGSSSSSSSSSSSIVSTVDALYYITTCDPSVPHIEHPKSCYKFLHCVPQADGSYSFVVKTCYPHTMFNPKTMICDWPATVKAMKPKCGYDAGEIEIWETEEVIMKHKKSLKTTTRQPDFRTTIKGIDTDYAESKLPYYIRTCYPASPLIEHPESCYKYLECSKLPNGSYVYAERSCGIDMMFNPSTRDCDWPDIVIDMKPMCRDRPGMPEIMDLKTVRPISPVTPPQVFTSTQKPFVPTAPIILPSTLTPPSYCDQGEMIYLMNDLPDSALSASSVYGIFFKPEFARLDSKTSDKSSGSWSPKTNDLNQFYEVTFPQLTPIYGVIIRGHPIFDQYVTSFKIIYSDDGFTYHVLEDRNNRPQIFSGSVDPKTPVKSIFAIPVEAKIVRLYPISWHGSISLRIELLGCKKTPIFVPELTTQRAPPTQPVFPPMTTRIPFGQVGPVVGPVFIPTTTKLPPFGQVGPGGQPIFGPPTTIRPPFGQVGPGGEPIFGPPTTTRRPAFGIIGPGGQPIFGPPTTTTEKPPRGLLGPDGMYIIAPPTTQRPMFTEAPIEPICDDPLGVENSMLSPSQIQFSSIKDAGSVKTKVTKNPLETIKLSSARGWMPLVNSQTEFVMFDFLENRKVTGIITKGGEYGWVKSYSVLFSHDNVIWNKIVDETGKPMEFLANVDSENIKKNLFKQAINARYVKIQPVKWYGAIEMKIEPIGCYLPYLKPDGTTTISPKGEVEIITPSSCGACKGVLMPRPVDADSCVCYPPLYWSGSECVPRTQCPCVEGHMLYEIGETYQTETCSDCICKIGGIPDCKPKVCTPCGNGLRRENPASCSCKCIRCPPEMVLCQTSGDCIPESAWCDGIQDCPDDELNCMITEKPSIHINRTESIVITKKCPDPVCPPGFTMKEKKSRMSRMKSRFSDSSEDDSDDIPQHQYYYVKAKYTASYEAILPISTNSKRQDVNSEECFEFMCIPITDEPDPDYAEEDKRTITRCTEPKCPRGYMIRLQIQKDSKDCAKFTCEPIIENDAVCKVTGRTFNTFDSTEFKYDICSHLLARDMADAKWNVIMRKNCSSGNNICSKEIDIKDKVSKYTLILYPSLSVNLDGYYFTVEQLQNSNRKMSFTVSKNGDNLLYVSHTHGIWVTLDQFGDVKLGISSQYAGQVDGLCGYFSNDKSDDKRKPTGELASSTVEFGDSWSVSREDCEPHVCPKALQDVAWTMCNLVKDEIFQPCHGAVDPTRFISKCLETACDCLLTATNGSSTAAPRDMEKFAKTCKCSMLKNYVVECMAADEAVHLETWRSVQSCEVSCVPPLVHHDCFRRKCESTCNNLKSSECTTVPGTCFSGCYCPSGTVRKDSTCIPISECRDCVCDGFGKSQYLTYDRKNFTFDGNCTYLLTRDITLKNIHTFQVYATIGPCDASAFTVNKATCTLAFHLVYGNHIVHIQKSAANTLEVIVDGVKLKSLPYQQQWMKVTEQGKTLNILLPESQVELISMFETMTFSIKVPSVKYANKMEGICGNCNGNPDDDMITNPAATNLPFGASPLKSFAMSWLAEEPNLELAESKDTCFIDDEANCLPLPPETDPCFKILDEDIFGKCHFVVDPIMYVTACQADLCKTGPTQKGSCETVAAYARECATNGVCVDWRKNGFCSLDCTAPFVYSSCGCAETCKTVEDKDKLIKASTALKDPANIAKLRSICSAGMREGCFCPKGTVLHNGKCLREAECRACDDKGHLPGDVWHPDVCSSCSCRNDSTIQCQKIECPSQQTICSIGYTAVETSTPGECCKKYVCVPETKTAKQISCPQLALPNCGTDQENKRINGTDGCLKFICDCVPKAKCSPLQNFTSLEPGFRKIIDTTGCCPAARLVCDKSLCPPKPAQCVEAFYTLDRTKIANDKICCDEYECRPPPNNCIATVGGKKILKKVDEAWPTDDVCVKAVCAFDTNGNPIIKALREACNAICQAGYELQPLPNKCCGQCVKTKCVIDNKLYEVGDEWQSDDKCTTFACNIKDGQTFISSMMETCPDVSKCSPLMRYTDGCCEKCKLEPLSQHNCLPESLAETTTIGLIKTQIPPHGTCKNVNPVRGITQCAGTCRSGTKFDPLTLHQFKDCDCCSVSGVSEIQVQLVCDDNYKLIKHVNVPSACSCSKCGADDPKLLKLTAAS